MKFQSAAIGAVFGALLLGPGLAHAQSQPAAQTPAQTEAAPPEGKKRSIVSVPSAGSNAASSAAQSGVLSARDDAARKAKARKIQ